MVIFIWPRATDAMVSAVIKVLVIRKGLHSKYSLVVGSKGFTFKKKKKVTQPQMNPNKDG